MISIEDLKNLCDRKAVRWTMHVLKRLILRNISQDEVIEAIQRGKVIEQYPEDYPFPSCLILGITVAGKYLHVVCGRGNEEVWIITAYYPDPEEWENNFETRRTLQ